MYPVDFLASPEAMANYAAVLVELGNLHNVSVTTGTDAVLYYPGVYDDDMAANLLRWKEQMVATSVYSHVLMAGHNVGYKHAELLQKSELQNVFGPFVQISTQVVAAHTGEQASWVAQQVVELELGVVEQWIFSAHGPRAYMTQLKALMTAGVHHDVLLLPRTLHKPPFASMPIVTPDDKGPYSQTRMIGAEAHKMLAYADSVATLAELEQYLARHL